MVEEEEEAHGGALPKVRDDVFPTLGDAVKVKETKADAKKGKAKKGVVKLGLGEFLGSAKPKFGRGGGLGEVDIMKRLPKGPRARSDDGSEEGGGGLGGAFGGYGGQRGGGGGDRGALRWQQLPCLASRACMAAPGGQGG